MEYITKKEVAEMISAAQNETLTKEDIALIVHTFREIFKKIAYDIERIADKVGPRDDYYR